jgi:hypothetical protein
MPSLSPLSHCRLGVFLGMLHAHADWAPSLKSSPATTRQRHSNPVHVIVARVILAAGLATFAALPRQPLFVMKITSHEHAWERSGSASQSPVKVKQGQQLTVQGNVVAQEDEYMYLTILG